MVLRSKYHTKYIRFFNFLLLSLQHPPVLSYVTSPLLSKLFTDQLMIDDAADIDMHRGLTLGKLFFAVQIVFAPVA